MSGVRESGIQRQLIYLPTTSGKTAVFAQLVRQGRRRGLGLAHREEFVTHHASKLHEVDPTMSVGIALRRRWHGVVPRVLAGAETVYILRGGQPQWPGLTEDRYFPPIPGGQVALKRDVERWRAFSFRDNKTGSSRTISNSPRPGVWWRTTPGRSGPRGWLIPWLGGVKHRRVQPG